MCGEYTDEEQIERAKKANNQALAATVCGEDAGSVLAGIAERELNSRGFVGKEIDSLRWGR